MPNSSSASTNACVLATENAGLNSTPNRLQAPVKSRLHSAWPGAPGSAGCSTCAHLRPLSQPVRDLASRTPSARCSRTRHGAHAAQRQPAIVRAGVLAQRRAALRARVSQSSSLFTVIAADQDVGVAGRVFRHRLDRHVHAMPERLEVVDAPGVVHQHLRARAHAPRGRSPARPAPRTCGCRGFPCTRRVVFGRISAAMPASSTTGS